MKLREGDGRPGERDGADQHAQKNLEDDVGRGIGRLDVDELGDGDQRGRSAAHPVEDRDQLRHRGHLHEACGRDGDDDANKHGQQNQQNVVQRVTVDVLEERRHNRDQHAKGRHHVAAASVLGTAETLQGDDERRRREQVQQVNQSFTTHGAPSSGLLGALG